MGEQMSAEKEKLDKIRKIKAELGMDALQERFSKKYPGQSAQEVFEGATGRDYNEGEHVDVAALGLSAEQEERARDAVEYLETSGKFIAATAPEQAPSANEGASEGDEQEHASEGSDDEDDDFHSAYTGRDWDSHTDTRN